MELEYIEVDEGRMRDFGWQHVTGQGTMRFLDNELAYIPGAGDTESVAGMFLLTAPIDGGFYGCELNVIVRTKDGGTLENIESAEGDTVKEAEMECCFWAATHDLFDRLDELEMNAEDATNRLAYESAALYENHDLDTMSDLEVVDHFLGMAREYVRDNGPSAGIEWVEF